MTLILELTIPGEPIPKMRPRFRNGHAFTPERTRTAETTIRTEFHRQQPDWVTIARGTNLRIDAEYHRRTRRAVDLDNLVKLTTDALNGVIWEDDDQIAQLRATRVYGSTYPRTVLRVHTITMRGDTSR